VPDKNDIEKALVEHGKGFVEDVLDADGDQDAVIEAIAEFLDKVVPMDVLVPGIAGKILEEKDVDVFEFVLRAIRDLAKVDPEKKAERQERRAERRDARKDRRAKKKADRASRREG
jgi:hypothetical protein